MSLIVVKKDLCDLCGTCVGVCPVNCMELTEMELSIDAETCILCRFCIDICPIEALEMTDE